MKYRYLRLLAALPLAAVLLYQPAATPVPAHASLYAKMLTIQKRLLSGVGTRALAPGEVDPTERDTAQPNTYYPTSDNGCPLNLGNNIKVNQNCLNLTDATLQGRAQAQNETAISHDPNNPQHLVATFNDYRRGDGNCYAAFSLDGGRTWADSTIPMSFSSGHPPAAVSTGDFGAVARQYWQGGGDTSIAWDTKGNAYFSCQVFQRGKPTTPNTDVSSAFLLFRSTQNNGGSWNFPGRYIRASAGVTATQAANNPFLDKQYMTVDNHVGSPFQDRIYVSWTEFAADGTAFIYEGFSSDYGESFSAPHLVNVSTSLCANDYGLAVSGCNENQFSQPFTGADGSLYIVYDNYNNVETKAGTDNRNQILISKSTDGGVTFGVPVKVADYYDLPDCATYQGGQDPGRACVPEKGSTTNSVFRAANYPSGSVNPRNTAQVVVTFGSYINKYSNETNGCTPTGISPATGINLYSGVKDANGCANKILVSVSNNAGTSFTGTTTDPRALTTVNQKSAQRKTDQWWQWQDFTKDGRLAVSYYDRQYGTDESTGYSDFSLSGSRDFVHFGTRRVTTSSLPPPTQFAGTFWGDYTGLTAPDKAYPLWSDTRPPDLFVCPGSATPGNPPRVCTGSATNAPRANDQDIFVAAVSIPLPGAGDDEGGNSDNGGGD